MLEKVEIGTLPIFMFPTPRVSYSYKKLETSSENNRKMETIGNTPQNYSYSITRENHGISTPDKSERTISLTQGYTPDICDRTHLQENYLS